MLVGEFIFLTLVYMHFVVKKCENGSKIGLSRYTHVEKK